MQLSDTIQIQIRAKQEFFKRLAESSEYPAIIALRETKRMSPRY